jgi:hypothetical protein
MFVFLKLVLAHLISDFVLQFEELYQLKLRSLLGYTFHAMIHACVALILLFPYLGEVSIWVFVGVIVLIHFYQDTVKYRWRKIRRYEFPIFVIDQLLHILLLSTVLLLPASKNVHGFPGSASLDFFYTNPVITMTAIAFVIATFAGSYLFNSFHISYGSTVRDDYLIGRFEITHAIVERSIILFVCMFSHRPLLFLLLPAAGFLRLPFKNLRNWTEFAVSFVYAVIVGFLFRLLVSIGET